MSDYVSQRQLEDICEHKTERELVRRLFDEESILKEIEVSAVLATAKAKTVNGECQIQALIDKKKVIITETSIRVIFTWKMHEWNRPYKNSSELEKAKDAQAKRFADFKEEWGPRS
ncbi:hypothetical protein Tco_0251520 [Tanacetum coccineum]